MKVKELFGSGELLLFLVGREITVRYRRSLLGLLWTLFQPLLVVLAWLVAFRGLFRVEVPDYPLYAVSGVLFWTFFQHGVMGAINSLQRNADVLRQLPVPSAVFPAAAVLSSAVHLLLSLGVLLAALPLLGGRLAAELVFLPAALVIVVGFVLGLGLLVAPLSVLFSDLGEATAITLNVMVYLTPVFYPISIVPPELRWIVLANPLTWLLAALRDPIAGRSPRSEDLLLASLACALMLLVGTLASQRARHRIPFHV